MSAPSKNSNSHFSTEQLLLLLKKYWGYTSFRTPQQEIIQSVLKQKDTLALLPTGSGKSICYQLPALLLNGVCIVISPLIALIKNQIDELEKRNIKVASLHNKLSNNDVVRIFDNLQFGNTQFLYLSPEKLQSEFIQEKIKQLNVSLIAIDEAHCISEWGHDFRPSYLQLHILREIHPSIPIIAVTATATKNVLIDINNHLLLKKAVIFKTSFQRKNNSYRIVKTENIHDKLLQILHKITEPTIIYAKHRRQTQQICDFLNANHFKASFYHGGLSTTEKETAYNLWMSEKTPVMVATNAFGMGINKANVRAVIHINIPQSLENYMQESGRAGRDGKTSYSFLITNNALIYDAQQHFLKNNCDVTFVKKIYNHLNQYFRISFGEIPTQLFPFHLQEFCKTYQLPIAKTYNALSILERERIIFIDHNFKKQSAITFLVNESEIFNYTQHPVYGNLIQTILRSYGGVLTNFCYINEHQLSVILKCTKSAVIKNLQKLHQQKIINYNYKNTASEIQFLTVREDDYTMNRISKRIQQQNKLKFDKFTKVIAYINNTSTCRNKLLLSYFGEADIDNCKMCDNCLKRTKTTVSYKKIASEIITILQKTPHSSKELIATLHYNETEVLKTLQLLLESDKIILNSQHKFQL